MKVIHPFLSRSDDRTRVEAYNPICGNPYKWFDTEYFRNELLFCISFNFLIDWRTRALQNVAWIKRIITDGYSTDIKEIAKSISLCDGKDFINTALSFCKQNNFSLQYVLIPNLTCDKWFDQRNKIIIFDVTKYASKINEGCVQEYSSMEFVQLIRCYKKDYHPIGKGKEKAITTYKLQNSETDLEVFLSEAHEELAYEGDTGFPGDADVVLFNNVGDAEAIIELKKHDVGSVKTAKKVSDESMSLYGLDSLKYDSLNILSSTLNCPFHVVFFPITEDPVIKIESFIPGPSGVHLYRCAANLYDLPKCNEKPSLEQFSKAFIDLNSRCCDMIGSYTPENPDDSICTAPSFTPYTCPNCGAPVRIGDTGDYYCFGRCGMKLMKFYGKELSAQQCESLLKGNEVPFVNAYNRSIRLLPKAVSDGQPYKGKQYHRWDFRYT